MEDNFRLTLIIISAIVIAAIFIHGFWTLRKNKNPYKLKPEKGAVDENYDEKSYDGSGFDQTGVSKPRVVGANPLAENEIPTEPAPAPEFSADPIPKDFEKEAEPDLESFVAETPIASEDEPDADLQNNIAQSVAASAESQGSSEPIDLTTAIETDDHEPSLGDLDATLQDIADTPVAEEPVYQTPVTQAKPEVKVKESNLSKATQNIRQTLKPKKAKRKADDLKRNQMDFNFGEETHEEPKAEKTTKADDVLAVEPEVIILSVVVPEGEEIAGAALLPTLLTLGMKYGEMDIFHRHEDNAGHGKVTFSLANMMNPGTFNLDEIETFSTQGVSLFMTLPNAGNAFEVFEQMLNSAKQLALEFKGQVLDDKRSVMTKQTEQHYMSRIRDFERKHRISNL